MNEKTTVTFLGSCANMPAGGGDSSSFVINRRYLVDTGWYAAVRMLSWGLDPAGLDYLFITHRHPDHTVGLPQLILHRRIVRNQRPEGELPPLNVVGPVEHLEDLVTRARHFLFMHENLVMQNLIPLSPGEAHETDEFRVTSCASRHTSPGLVYRFADKRTGAELAFTGDTQYDAAIVEHVRGVDLLIHDACYSDDDPFDKPGRHARPKDAARVAKEAGVGRLALIHAHPSTREKKVAAAREVFPNTFWPADGETVEVG